MPGLDETKQFVPLKIAVLTISDSRSLKDDKSGAVLVQRIVAAGHYVAERSIVTDDIEAIRARVKAWIADPVIDVIITTGGTGFTGRDVTPEAVEPLFDKKMDGFSALFLVVSFPKIGTSAIPSRATAGVAGSTYRLCLPGSPGISASSTPWCSPTSRRACASSRRRLRPISPSFSACFWYGRRWCRWTCPPAPPTSWRW
jgi:molybdenum cofactor biosynthesis protein B